MSTFDSLQMPRKGSSGDSASRGSFRNLRRSGSSKIRTVDYAMKADVHPGHSMTTENRPNRSETIPLPKSHIHRTKSELQLCEDLAAAEWRDMCMFHRLVSGIRERQHAHYTQEDPSKTWEQEPALVSNENSPVIQTERSLKNIIWTRYHKERKHQFDVSELHPEMISGHDSLIPMPPRREGAHNSQARPRLVSRTRCLHDVLQKATDPEFGIAGNGDWSMTGFSENRSYLHYEGTSVYLPEAAKEEDDPSDGEVFSLDL